MSTWFEIEISFQFPRSIKSQDVALGELPYSSWLGQTFPHCTCTSVGCVFVFLLHVYLYLYVFVLYNNLAADRSNISSMNLRFKWSSRDKYVATPGQTFAECILLSRPLGHALGEAPQTPPSSMRGQTQRWWAVSVFLMGGQTLFLVATFWHVCVASSKVFNMFCSAFYNFSTIWWRTVSSGFGSWEVRRSLQFPLYLYFSSSHSI